MTEFKLRPDQELAVQWTLTHKRAGLFLPMGFGKTLVTLVSLTLMGAPRTLVVAPPTVIRDTWPREIEKWTPWLRVVRVDGSPARRLKALTEDGDVYLLSAASLTWLVEKGLSQAGQMVGAPLLPFEVLVLDELSLYKSRKSSRWKAADLLANGKRPAERVIGLTGTPASNGLLDLWPEMKVLDGGASLGKFITHFRDRFFRPDNPHSLWPKMVPKPGAEDQIHRMIADTCLSLGNESVAKLIPPVLHNIVEVPLDPALEKGPKGYGRYLRNSVLGVLGYKNEGAVAVPILAYWAIPATSAAVLRQKALQWTAGFMYDTETGRVEQIHQRKLDRLKDIIEGLNGDPALVFYMFKEEKAQLLKAFPQAMSATDSGAIDKWNAGDLPILIAHPASAGHGLNLQFGGHNIIWMTLTDSSEKWRQANARLARPGQMHPVTITALVTPGTFDEKVLDNVQGKISTEDFLLEHLREINALS